jgi:hypothetical protein
MSDTNPAENNATTPAEPVVPPSQPIQLPDDHPLVRTLAAQKEQIKELRTKAGRLDEIEEAQKSEVQKALDRAEAAERRALAAETAHLKSSTAARHGVPEELLSGSTAEELEASAQRLIAFKGTAPNAPSSEGQGRQGEPVSAGVRQLTRDEFNRLSPEQKLEAREKGQLANLLGE